MAGKKTNTQRSIESYEHRDKQRLNNPPVGLVTPENDRDAGQKKKTYAYDPHLDPQLVWAGKAEHTSFEVPTVSLHVHERIDPRTIIEAVRKKDDQAGPVQLGLFEEERKEPLRQAIEFYQHKHGWTNRLIAGDSLLVMNSLLEKEGMAGKVQMIYFDPPYGIKYGSNFQPFVNKRDVKDGKDEDLTSEPEQIKAFRDTWELGIHSYLTYLRDRLLLCRELLSESGSIFVQIGDENVHRVRCLMDEVFGAGNFVAMITYKTTGGARQEKAPKRTSDFLLWYCKQRAEMKFRRLFSKQDPDTTIFSEVEEHTGVRRPLTDTEKRDVKRIIEKGLRLVTTLPLHSKSPGDQSPRKFQAKTWSIPTGSWRYSEEGFKRLGQAGRLVAKQTVLRSVSYFDDWPYEEVTSNWNDTGPELVKIYAVQTNTRVIARCLLMTTDPGDLVFDPTCGSGTTAYVAEQWGRRWITCDTSRVAITLARQRLMTAVFDYYELAHPQEGVGSGFKYKTVPHVTLKSIANNPEIDDIYARLHPAVEEALAELNAALKGQAVKFKVTQGGRAGHFVDFAAPDTETFTMPAGQVVKVNELVEWEVPFEFPADWPEAARTPFERFHQARRALRAAIDEAIARHAPQETLYDQPFVDRKKVRVTGPFTVEAVPAPAVKSVDEILEPKPEPADASIARSGETLRQEEWRDELLKTGIRGKNGQYIRFARLEPLPACRWLHAVGETRPSDEGANTVRESAPAYDPLRVVVSFGPEYGPLEQRQVEQAWEEARMLVPRPKLLIFAAFQFDPEAAKDIDEMKPELAGMQFLKVQMNADLLTDDLKKKRASNESFWLIGQPDVYLERIADGEDKGKYRVSVLGFDYYNTKTGQIESGGADRIALWMLDTDYDGRSLYPRQVFFPMAGEKEGWAKLARNLRAEIDEERIEAYRGTVSLPFALGEHRRIAVKIVDDRGIESLKVVKVDP
ncbi:site-specific DNA-methyltransferase [Synechococcus sp. R65.1]|uniref:site-specific DNA-methyltransferase n=1 Tax=Synechococcus sp. R65.1 TaxID=2964524 RepID=UPI0039C48C4A